MVAARPSSQADDLHDGGTVAGHAPDPREARTDSTETRTRSKRPAGDQDSYQDQDQEEEEEVEDEDEDEDRDARRHQMCKPVAIMQKARYRGRHARRSRAMETGC